MGRDPQDVSLSWDHHWENMDLDAFIAVRADAVGLADLGELGPPPEPAPSDPAERFWSWATPDTPAAGPTLAAILAQFQKSWDRRNEPNVALFHYSDLSADLLGQMRRLAGVLGIDVAERRLRALAEAASFDRMKARAPHRGGPDQVPADRAGTCHPGTRRLGPSRLARRMNYGTREIGSLVGQFAVAFFDALFERGVLQAWSHGPFGYSSKCAGVALGVARSACAP